MNVENKISPITGCRMHFGPVGTNRGMFFSVAKEPTNDEEYTQILEELIRMSKSPTIEDKEVLGKYSV